MSRDFRYRYARMPQSLDLLQLHALNPERYPHLLCSASEGGDNNRFDILMAFPEETLCLTPNGLSSDLPQFAQNLYERDGERFETRDFLNTFDEWFMHVQAHVQRFDLPREDDVLWVNDVPLHVSDEQGGITDYDGMLCTLPFKGGWFMYLAYEMAGKIEPTLNLSMPKEEPLAFATRFTSALIYDKQAQCTYWMQEAHHDRYHAESVLSAVLQDADNIQQQPISLTTKPISTAHLQESDEMRYLKHVARVKDYILAGDVFQVNLSRLWHATLKGDISNADVFSSLRAHNPSPFAAMMHFPGLDVISSSPERLISVRNGLAETRPIAGTRPRLNRIHDEQVKTELLENPKERSEHIMLIDLERNDLGRVCQPGTVEVNELMVTEQYAHVHHIVSNVRGQLREGILPGQVIAAVFPGGTITGCPKVRCIEILADLEREPRGAYTGSLGYVNLDGDMDLNILIRTLTRHGKQLTFRAGGGIVYDSIPDKELQETRAKAKGLLSMLVLDNQKTDTHD